MALVGGTACIILFAAAAFFWLGVLDISKGKRGHHV